MKLFARITKIDEAARTVEGVIADETPDMAKEVFDYEASKGHFESWSTAIAKATDGKSVGNVRAMHGNVVAGVTKDIAFDDSAKQITVKAHIVDDNEWNKTKAGCYTGFSIGGKYEKKWPDPDDATLTRYAAVPSEYSLVDMPCNPNAQFSAIKADGAAEMRKFADPVARAASRILAKAGDNTAPLDALVVLVGAEPVAKGMWDVSRLAELLSSLNYQAENAEWEAEWEGDNSPIPADLRAAVKTLADILIRMAQEEVAELIADTETLALSAPDTLNKSAEDAMNEDMKKIQQAHDDALAKVAELSGERDAALAKAAETQTALDSANATITAQDELMAKAVLQIDASAAVIKANNEAIAALRAAPQPVRVALTAIAKGQDIGEAPGTVVEDVKKADGTVDAAATALRKALANPVFVS